MIIGVILPHAKLYGGVKRFFELGNLFIQHGHDFIVFNEIGDHPDWFDFKGKIAPISELKTHTLDVLFFTEPSYYQTVSQANTKQRIFYFVKSGEKIKAIVNDPRFRIYTNSSNLFHECVKRYGIAPVKALGGIDTTLYFVDSFEQRNPEKPFTIIAFGRLNKKRKGTRIIVKACERVAKKYAIKLLLFDTPTDPKVLLTIQKFKTTVDCEFILNHPYSKNPELFHRADVFISAEGRTGYSNTSAEAMACGIPVIATESGTLDFLFHEKTGLRVRRNRYSIARAIRRLIQDETLRLSLAKAGRAQIENLSWDKLFRIIEADLSGHQNESE